MNEQSLEEKTGLFFQAIESLKTGNDGTIYIKWKNNVVHEIPGNELKLISGLKVTEAKEIHLNPNVKITPDDIHNIDEVVWKDGFDEDLGI